MTCVFGEEHRFQRHHDTPISPFYIFWHTWPVPSWLHPATQQRRSSIFSRGIIGIQTCSMIRISNYEFQWPFSCSFCRWFLIHFFTNDRRLIPKPCESQSIKSAIRVTASLPTWPQQKGHRGSKAPQGEHGAGTSDLMVSHQTKPPHWRHLQIFAQHGDTHDIPFFCSGCWRSLPWYMCVELVFLEWFIHVYP